MRVRVVLALSAFYMKTSIYYISYSIQNYPSLMKKLHLKSNIFIKWGNAKRMSEVFRVLLLSMTASNKE